MSKYQDYADKPTEFLALTGYTRTEFDALLPTGAYGCQRLIASCSGAVFGWRGVAASQPVGMHSVRATPR